MDEFLFLFEEGVLDGYLGETRGHDFEFCVDVLLGLVGLWLVIEGKDGEWGNGG